MLIKSPIPDTEVKVVDVKIGTRTLTPAECKEFTGRGCVMNIRDEKRVFINGEYKKSVCDCLKERE